jgi:hypothetical protein
VAAAAALPAAMQHPELRLVTLLRTPGIQLTRTLPSVRIFCKFSFSYSFRIFYH